MDRRDNNGNNNILQSSRQKRSLKSFERQCLKPVYKETVFCKKHLTPLYKDHIEKLKSDGLSIDQIVNNEAWSWNPDILNKKEEQLQQKHQQPQQQQQLEKYTDSEEFVLDESLLPFTEFLNNNTKRLNSLRKKRLISSKLNNKPNSKKEKPLKQKVTKKQEKVISIKKTETIKEINKGQINNKIPPIPQQPQQIKIMPQQMIEASVTTTTTTTNTNATTTTSTTSTIPNSNISNKEEIKKTNQNIFFNKVSNLMDDLGWSLDDDEEEE
ncbi:hypothetical protein DICPUDRAFT_81418 [Dictyostelium purpureum]|uniref:Uncharacterized protein n=1 Tax=Dictyostelium purpureum TaxID=5786 RepID=F0ZTF0_DICPU|nr:uncharacterized protein DICPUDRAFT_81418 [Dictyostelium purpureum]EGC32780.1 hypothetical protein DICPUDRAFT_81418 [Dictyostelium purpureum]|eukprot:XP_003290703.1 hypothetical protein DICPUDRAFT_81418 [Dictyostelium purpureum]